MMPPGATYRIQFRGGTDLAAAASLAPYLAELGISHLYASPIFRAAPGSTHGYDVADFCEIEPEIGGVEGFEQLSAALKEHGLGLILDFVPNHMGATPFNPWWRDVLEWGRSSDFAEHFDIDWDAPKLFVPALGQPYGQALAEGQFSLDFDPSDGGISFAYFDLRLPLTPPSYGRILAKIDKEPFPELARRFAVSAPESAGLAKAELAGLAADPATLDLIRKALADTSADTSTLNELHEGQAWRLSFWRAARERLTYRRFFEIADLVGVRVERQRVFDDVHKLLLQLVADGKVDGIRLDHIDGLADPKTYLTRLQEVIGAEQPFYLVVEKILGPGEELPPSWPVAGTTGYEFIDVLAGLFVDSASKQEMTSAYEAFLGTSADYESMVLATKRRILSRNLAGELERLKEIASALAERDPVSRDIGFDSLRRAILEFAAALPVYRTYVNVEGPSETDIELIDAAAEAVRAGREVEDDNAIAFIVRTLKLDFPDPELQAAALEFNARFQQTTGPVMAKALEDTVFYRFNRLVALNEVGGEPDHFGASVHDFHRVMARRAETQPAGLSATATHDTKRGEDGRARLYAISEMPERWAEAAGRWSSMLSGARRDDLDGGPAPEPELEWLFYQALAGAWPAEMRAGDPAGLKTLQERMDAYMIKVVREAKARTSWTAPVEPYEKAVSGFVEAAFAHDAFLQDFLRTAEPLMIAGVVNSLTQLAIKIAAPGVPDIYQGTEFWDLSLVDPDNRRPVDYPARIAAIGSVEGEGVEDLLSGWRSARLKLRLLKAGLNLRRSLPDLFASGEYLPLEAEGAEASRLVAFARRRGGETAIVVAPRLVLPLLRGSTPLVPPDAWGDTRIRFPDNLKAGHFRDVVTGAELRADNSIRVADCLVRFPVALLTNVR